MSLAEAAPSLSAEADFQARRDACIAHLQSLKSYSDPVPSEIQTFMKKIIDANASTGRSSESNQQPPSAFAPLHVAQQPDSSHRSSSVFPNSYANVVKYSRGFSPPRTTTDSIAGKFVGCAGLKEYPSGQVSSFQAGLLHRIGMPHLEYFKAMRSEHCEGTGCRTTFTTRNYDIQSCAAQEWAVVVDGVQPSAAHMRCRVLPDIQSKRSCESTKKAGLRMEEVVAVVLYTGPMYYLYNTVLSRSCDSLFDDGQSIWCMLSGNTGRSPNLFSTTLNVLVSAVQKLSAVTVYVDGLHLYRGTGGEVHLPSYFFDRDLLGCKGMTDWGFFSATSDMTVAVSLYSGAQKGKSHPMVFEIQTNCIDHGASVSEYSQYPQEKEFIFVPCCFIEQVMRDFFLLCSFPHLQFSECSQAL
jgi:hypothetical protein